MVEFLFELINIGTIVRDHFASLREDAHKRWILLLFFIIPIGVAYFLVFMLNRILQPSSLSALITMFTLFSGLILNVVVFLFNIATRAGSDLGIKNPESKPRKLIEHVYVNSLYSVLVAVSTLTILVLVLIIDLDMSPSLPLIAVSFVVYSVTAHFIMTLLMVVKRLYALLTEHLQQTSK